MELLSLVTLWLITFSPDGFSAWWLFVPSGFWLMMFRTDGFLAWRLFVLGGFLAAMAFRPAMKFGLGVFLSLLASWLMAFCPLNLWVVVFYLVAFLSRIRIEDVRCVQLHY